MSRDTERSVLDTGLVPGGARGYRSAARNVVGYILQGELLATRYTVELPRPRRIAGQGHAVHQ